MINKMLNQIDKNAGDKLKRNYLSLLRRMFIILIVFFQINKHIRFSW